MNDRYARGRQMLEAVDGQAGVKVVDELARHFPEFERYVLEFPFGDIYSRPGLSLQQREIAVVAALTAKGGCEPQLKVHIHAALHVGCTPREVVETVYMMAVYAGFPAALNALRCAREVFAECGVALPLAA